MNPSEWKLHTAFYRTCLRSTGRFIMKILCAPNRDRVATAICANTDKVLVCDANKIACWRWVFGCVCIVNERAYVYYDAIYKVWNACIFNWREVCLGFMGKFICKSCHPVCTQSSSSSLHLFTSFSWILRGSTKMLPLSPPFPERCQHIELPNAAAQSWRAELCLAYAGIYVLTSAIFHCIQVRAHTHTHIHWTAMAARANHRSEWCWYYVGL